MITTKEIHGEERSVIYISSLERPIPHSFMQAKKEPGWICRNGTLREWKWLGLTQFDGSRYIYCEPLELLPFNDLFSAPAQKALSYIRDLAMLFERAAVDGFIPEDAIYLLEEGGVLLLPRNIINLQAAGKDQQMLHSTYERWVRPGFRGSRAAVYQLTSFLYRLTGGEVPLEESDARDDGYRPVPLEMLRAGLDGDAARWVKSILNSRKSQDVPDIGTWIEKFDQFSGEFAKAAGSPPDSRLAQYLSARRKRAGRNRFLRKRGTVLAAGIVVLAVVIAFSISMISRALKPPVTAGLGPMEVVTLFYQSQNDLDSTLLEQCLDKGVKSSAENLVTYLFVTSRTRLAYEQTDGIIHAAEWISEGQPEIPAGHFIYGIVNLQITTLDQDTFRAEYDLWVPASGEDEATETGMVSERLHVIEELDVRQEKSWWVITEIREISRE